MPDERDAAARRDAAVDRFVALVAAADAEDPGRSDRPALDDAALEIALAADPSRAADAADGARAELDRLAAGIDGVDALVRRLYVEEGFTGPGEDYYDPRNSSLLDVLDRRVGIPITLAVLCLEVGRRAGVALQPVGMPGHFLVRPPGDDRHLDPLTGELADHARCEALFRSSTGAGPDVAFDPARMLPAIGHRAVLVRMLTNLRAIHRAHGRAGELRWVLTMRAALPGVSAEEILELAGTLGRRAAFGEAAALLDDWSGRLPGAADRLRRVARSWRARLN